MKIHCLKEFTVSAIITASALAGFTGCSQGSNNAGQEPMPINVVAVDAETRRLSETLPVVGNISPNEIIDIKPEISGRITELNFNEGESVSEGQVLVRLDDSETSAMLEQARAEFKLSRANLERSRALREEGTISPQELDQAEANFEISKATLALRTAQLDDTRIIAPFEGFMGKRQISVGQVVSPTTTIAWLVDLDPVKVEFNVPERFLGKLHKDQTINIGIAAYPEESFEGKVYFIDPRIDEDTRTAFVKAIVPNPDHKLKAGMFANIEITMDIRTNAIVIPETALMMREEQTSVYTVTADNKVELRPVTVGIRLPGKAEIIDGLSAGETVVVEGTQKLQPGAPVKLAPTEEAGVYLDELNVEKDTANKSSD
ncbi:MAG: efflux RND transporter periplasmic adaptor subunit [Verrucomicrobia bacterium]|nr:efflux RND transporter periplasmic adaptor subunit [Verrucomicrobiota bacterium]